MAKAKLVINLTILGHSYVWTIEPADHDLWQVESVSAHPTRAECIADARRVWAEISTMELEAPDA